MKRQYTETEKRALVAQYATGIAPVQTLAKTDSKKEADFWAKQAKPDKTVQS